MKASTLLLLIAVNFALLVGFVVAVKLSSGFRDFLNVVGKES